MGEKDSFKFGIEGFFVVVTVVAIVVQVCQENSDANIKFHE